MSSETLDRLRVLDARLARRLDVQADGCWLWTGARNSHGYGNLARGGVHFGAHRYVYELLGNELVPGLVLDHLCEVRTCVNPGHLDQVTQRANVLRADGVASRNLAKMACPALHPLDAANTYITPDGSRRCRTCNTESQRRRRLRLQGEAA